MASQNGCIVDPDLLKCIVIESSSKKCKIFSGDDDFVVFHNCLTHPKPYLVATVVSKVNEEEASRKEIERGRKERKQQAIERERAQQKLPLSFVPLLYSMGVGRKHLPSSGLLGRSHLDVGSG